jgi:2-polyprenyl-3-methyl-5-hydroxy-6-metoxy-1,4-benzoquinol methylase
MYSTKVCPICDGGNFKSAFTCMDYTVSHETFQLVRCSSCGFLITSPRPENNDLEKYYQSEKYISHSDKTAGIIDLIYKVSRVFTLQSKVSLIKKFSTKKNNFSVLDFGCGTGGFLAQCKSSGLQVSGVEPSEKARAIASKKTDSEIKKSLDDLRSNFDVITLFHVLEHVPELNQTLMRLASLLEKNGTMFIAVPNHESYDAQLFKSQWAAYDVPRHLWHFSKENMTDLLNKHNLIIKSIIPMKLDSYYVSIMSEKALNKKSTVTGLARGIWRGLISNIKAKRNNHSSLIYVACKK